MHRVFIGIESSLNIDIKLSLKKVRNDFKNLSPDSGYVNF